MSVYGKVGLLDCPITGKEEKATHVFSNILWLKYSPIEPYEYFFKCACGNYHKMDRQGKITTLRGEELDWLLKKIVVPELNEKKEVASE